MVVIKYTKNGRLKVYHFQRDDGEDVIVWKWGVHEDMKIILNSVPNPTTKVLKGPSRSSTRNSERKICFNNRLHLDWRGLENVHMIII